MANKAMAVTYTTSSCDLCQLMMINSTWYDAQWSESETVDPMRGFPYPSFYSWTHIVLASFVVTVIMLAIVVGNGLVVVAIAVDRRLNGVQHWFIGSLAVSDLLVGLFIMPFSLANELMGYWTFGDVICQLWLSTDVLLCTASILNLCLISLDRYWSITRPINYVRKRTPARAAVMISIVWILSVIISVPPLIGWKRPQPVRMGFPRCQLSEELGYVVYSTVGSFYVPLLVMVVVYVNIYLAARARARRNLKPKSVPSTITTTAVLTSRLNNVEQPSRVVQMEVDSCDDFECDENFPDSQSPGKQKVESDCSEAVNVEESQIMLPAASSECSKKQELGDDEAISVPVVQHQLAVEYHPVHEEYSRSKRRCSRSRGNSVSMLDSAAEDRLLPKPTPPRSLAALNAKRRAEFFGLSTASKTDNSDQVIHVPHLCDVISSAATPSGTPSSRDAGPLPQQPRPTKFTDERERTKRKLARARERRATLVLGIVMASFIGCWLPFFSIYPLSLLFDLDVPDGLFAVIFWLGYCNSALNPIIYTIFNREFRAAFASVLCRRRRAGRHGGQRGR